jgi:hypothetical protein
MPNDNNKWAVFCADGNIVTFVPVSSVPSNREVEEACHKNGGRMEHMEIRNGTLWKNSKP